MSRPTPAPEVFPAVPVRIFLAGFMGAGKTTVGALLAGRLRWEFVDSDRVVEARAGAAIAEIFSRQGEAAFRRLEAEAIREAAQGEQRVIGLGGGALESAATRGFLASLPDSVLVFLDASLETLLARCGAHVGGPVRPVLADRAHIEERWRARLPFYRQAQLTVDTSALAPEAVAERILDGLDAKIAASGSTSARPAGAPWSGERKPGVPA